MADLEENAAEPLPDAPPDQPSAAASPSGVRFAKVRRALSWVRKWHPLLFLGASLCLALVAWRVYPQQEERQVPPAESFYLDGLDRLYRVINPDLPLIAATPADEALAARNAFLNLLVFHRSNLSSYPQFVNPHLLLAEADRILAEYSPPMADKYYSDAVAAYSDAQFWENREDSAQNMAIYVLNNFLADADAAQHDLSDTPGVFDFFDAHNDEIALRRTRRADYIGYRKAEAELAIGKPEAARPVLEDLQRRTGGRWQEEIQRFAGGENFGKEPPRHAFELGVDDYRRLDFLLAKAYDGLGFYDRAKEGYLKFLATSPGGREHMFVIERLAAIAMDDGEQYRRINAQTATDAFAAAIRYYQTLAASPSASSGQRETALLGLARANSRLADLEPPAPKALVDELTGAGRTVKSWLEAFSGQPLPARTLALAAAVGGELSSPELSAPGPLALAELTLGSLAAMAGGETATPYEKRRDYLSSALAYYDRIAQLRAGSDAGSRAAVLAARESLKLGDVRDAEARFNRMLDPLAPADLHLAARLGLATIALDRGDLRKTHMLLLGGYAHPAALWFVPEDADWRKLAAKLGDPAGRAAPGVWRRVWEMLPGEGRSIAEYAASGRRLDEEYVNRLLRALNTMLRSPDFYRPEDFPPNNRNAYLARLLARNPETLAADDVVWRNRLLLEEAWPYDLSQKAAKGNIGFEPFPPGNELYPGGLVDAGEVRDALAGLARGWALGAARQTAVPDRLRMVLAGLDAYRAALDRYAGDPGDINYELAAGYEELADIRETQGNHVEALSMTAAAARHYLEVSLKARGSPREMDALLAAGDAFFRAGLLERAVESQKRFLDRFGYSARPGSDGAMAVVRAENLLGRAYWFLGDAPNALASFARNIPRRTPDRYKSIYYMGRVMMEEGAAGRNPQILGEGQEALPALDRNGDPQITTALQAFNFLRQSPGINPSARAWRWSTFDLGKLRHLFAQRARQADEEARRAAAAAPAAGQAAAPPGEAPRLWIPLYEDARRALVEALERYPLRTNGGPGVSVRVEPEDYADVMASRFETEYLLADTLLVLAEANGDASLSALARAHLANLADRSRYADALFDTSLDRFQLNSAVIRETVEGDGWNRNAVLPRTRLGDDEGPTHSPSRLRDMLRNGLLTLAGEYMRAGEQAARREDGAAAADTLYRRAYETYQDVYDRFGPPYGSLAMLGMADSLARLGRQEDADNHYRMAENIANMQPDTRSSDGLLDIGPSFWGSRASDRLRDRGEGYRTP